MENIIQFIVGKTYFTSSICDSECIYRFEVVRRNDKSVWINNEGKVQRKKISIFRDTETFMPFGSYSMAPIIRADRFEGDKVAEKTIEITKNDISILPKNVVSFIAWKQLHNK